MKHILLLVALSIHLTILACDCDQPRPSVKSKLNNSKAVFTGTIISSKKSNFKDTLTGKSYNEFFISVHTTIKGDSTKKEMVVLTEESDCGIFLKIGEPYLIYAFETSQKGPLFIVQCHANCPPLSSDMAKKDLDEIKRLKE